MSDSIVNAGGTNQLTYDDALCSIDHESTSLCHQGKVAHENLMFADFFFFLIIEPHSHRQRCCIGSISLFTFFNGIFHIILAQFEIDKFKA